MSLPEVRAADLLARLRDLGVASGETLVIHGALQFFGRPVGGVGLYLDVLQELVGAAGTLVAPTFTFGFARGEPFDPAVTPSKGMGAFAEALRTHPAARRTPHPLQSLAALGRRAADLAARDTLGAFDPGSAWEALADARILLLGADVDAVSLVHLAEGRQAVPYRFWKDFSGPVSTPTGWQTCTYRMFARRLDLDPQLTLHSIQADLEGRGEWQEAPLNFGRIATCRAADFLAAVHTALDADPWALLANRAAVLARRAAEDLLP
jgi:aminoglycoside N3'-acetyltransferase